MLVWTEGAGPFTDLLAAALILLAGVMSLAAGVGLLRFPDTMQRLHAGAKPQVLGVIVICIAIVLRSPSWPTVALASLVVVFQMLTQPIAAHMVGRAAYRDTGLDRTHLVLDEMAEDVREADRAAERGQRRRGRA
ncbi:monovalent cation/H(+) antiporter subunit G [Demequina sp.]|uniref:monovalent cation/H(+) antiporter subunit G n=1 Tax=Demequina sp. TaxID=2050685 RepID=UPI003A89B8DA